MSENLEQRQAVKQILEQYEKISVGRAKAEAMAYLLKNARLKVCPQERFADQLDHGELLKEYCNALEQKAYAACKSALQEGEAAREVSAYSFYMDFGHIAPDWSFVIQKGFVGILERLYRYRAEAAEESEAYAFYTNSIIVYEAILQYLVRLAEACEACGTPQTAFAALNLRHLAAAPPQTLAQAMQLTLVYYHLQMSLDCVIVRSLGGLDRLYAPFYQADVESGRFSEAQERELIREFLLRCSAIKAVANLPFYICGRDSNGKDATCEFTGILLEEYRELDIYDPKLHVMYHKDMNQKVLLQILTMIREGKNSFVFINHDMAVKALEAIGVAPEDAAKVIVYGCYETAAEGTEIPCTCAGKVNMAKAVEYAMQDGMDSINHKQVGLHTGTAFSSYPAFLEAVKAQLVSLTERCMQDLTTVEPYMGQVCPAPMMSATFASGMEKGRDLYDGGAKYNNTSIVGSGIATLVDSVLAVKRLVFEEKRLTFAELAACLEKNWEGQETLRMECLGNQVKYGNHRQEADELTEELFGVFADHMNGRPNGRGGVFRCGLFSVDWRFWMGEKTGATPDGRRMGEVISKNAAATVGQDRSGVTAYLLSMLSLDGEKLPDGCVADAVLHHSAVRGEDGLEAFRSLLVTYMSRGGFAVHFNVLNPEILKKAQQEPEKYRNLQVRVCGWNAHFVDLSRQEQEEFILQSAEYGA